MKIKLNSDQEVVNTVREGLKRTGAALELHKALLRELLEHPRHGLPRGADVLGDLFMSHANRIRAGALRFGQKKARQPPVKALEQSLKQLI